MGRPTKYKPEYCDQAMKLCLLGAINEELAKFFDVAVSTIGKWIAEEKEFSDAIRDGREKADAQVAKSLYHRANGYSHSEDKIFIYKGAPVVVKTIKHYPPDTKAAEFFLKNRRPDLWRDRHEFTGPDGGPLIQTIERVIVEPDNSKD